MTETITDFLGQDFIIGEEIYDSDNNAWTIIDIKPREPWPLVCKKTDNPKQINCFSPSGVYHQKKNSTPVIPVFQTSTPSFICRRCNYSTHSPKAKQWKFCPMCGTEKNIQTTPIQEDLDVTQVIDTKAIKDRL